METSLLPFENFSCQGFLAKTIGRVFFNPVTVPARYIQLEQLYLNRLQTSDSCTNRNNLSERAPWPRDLESNFEKVPSEKSEVKRRF
ncbi:hypothetical protein pipiens_001499 [Culex pipiens pipiens]|uniref:Uncharacterized protein n=1 Tax=Culex pipiens pipiens TaxID=38569 RepID=A0ABD1CNL0_CULPP